MIKGSISFSPTPPIRKGLILVVLAVAEEDIVPHARLMPGVACTAGSTAACATGSGRETIPRQGRQAPSNNLAEVSNSYFNIKPCKTIATTTEIVGMGHTKTLRNTKPTSNGLGDIWELLSFCIILSRSRCSFPGVPTRNR